jgi:ATP-dependent RNA helicase DOB1
MEDDNLFSNFSRQEVEPSSKKEKTFIGKKRNGETITNNKPEDEKIQPEKDESKKGQNLENIINEKMEEENINDKNAEDIVEINEVDLLKKEKEYLKNQINKVFPEVEQEIKNIQNTPNLLNENNNDIKINNNQLSETKNKNSELSKSKSEEPNKPQNQETTKITFDYEQEKEKYDNLISDKDIQIEKENFEGGYHETIYLKSYPYDNSTKIKSFDKILNPAHNFPFELDEFQKKSIICLENGESVLVSAHTSAGKTVVAQYAIAMAKRNHQRVIYTSPIKALSNQKYRDLKELFGDVGLMTGDVTRNENASCIVMTTEILRNMLFKGNEITKEIAWVIFDEVHYMRDRDRGVVWEETIILLSNKINYVFLSATIPNAREFGMWIAKLKKQPCNVVYTSFRPTPLRHYIFPVEGDNSNLFLILDSQIVNKKGNKKAVEEIFHNRNFNQAFDILKNSRKLENCNQKSNKNLNNKKIGTKMSLIKLIKALYREKFCPVIVFSFSKRECEMNALDLFKYKPLQKSKYDSKNIKKKETKEKIIDFNTDEEKEKIEKIYLSAISKLSEDDQKMPNIQNFLPLLQRGIGVHHGGMLPILKELVELLFQEGLIKVLFSTETFSMGINMPAKTVVFTTLRKFDGEFQRYLGGGEYTQMAGRAGRRGIDQFGNVIIMVDKNIDQDICEKIIKGKSAPLISSFQLSYNQLANLMRIEGLEPDHILSQSFRQFQKEKSIPILKKKLAKLYNEYNINKFDDINKEVQIKEIYELEETLKKLKNDYRTKIFVPKFIKQYLCLGRIVKLKYFGHGIVINCKIAKEIKLNNKDNSDIITEYNSNKSKENENINLSYNEEDIYLKHIGFNEDMNSSFDSNNDNINDITINKRLLRNKEFVNDTISNTHNSQKLNSNLTISSDNVKDNTINQELVIDCLVSLRNHTDVNGCLCPGNFEEGPDTFYGIIPLTITMIEEIYEVRAKMVVDLKDQRLVDDYGKRLKEIKKRMNDDLPILNVVKLNNIVDPEITKLLDEISDIEDKYNKLKDDYTQKYIKDNDEDNNNDLQLNLQKYILNNKLEKEIKKIITKIESSKSLVLNTELVNMKRVMRRLDFVTKDEALTPKGHLICDISGADELVTAELLFSGFFKDMTIEEIGASIYCCLSKENTGKKEDIDSTNTDINAQKKMKKIYNDILSKVNYIADILEECKIFLGDDEKRRYIESFNDNYMMPMYKWISGYKFDKLIAEYYTLYEGSLIRVIRRVEEFSKSFETSVEYIGDYNLKKKLEEMEEKIKRDLPFASSLYLE